MDILFVCEMLWELYLEKDNEYIVKGFYCEIFTALRMRLITKDVEKLDIEEIQQTLRFIRDKLNL